VRLLHPGMVLAAKALLDHTPHPTDDQIRRGLVGNLCRCTGYAKIIEAVRAVSNSGTVAEPPVASASTDRNRLSDSAAVPELPS